MCDEQKDHGVEIEKNKDILLFKKILINHVMQEMKNEVRVFGSCAFNIGVKQNSIGENIHLKSLNDQSEIEQDIDLMVLNSDPSVRHILSVLNKSGMLFRKKSGILPYFSETMGGKRHTCHSPI